MHAIESDFKEFARDVMSGDLNALASWFAFPLAIYAESKVSVFQNWSGLLEYFTFYRAELMARGAVSVSADVVAMPMMRGHSGTIWMNDTFYDQDGTQVAVAQVRYFFNIHSGKPQIALIEYQQLPIFDSFEELGLTREN